MAPRRNLPDSQKRLLLQTSFYRLAPFLQPLSSALQMLVDGLGHSIRVLSYPLDAAVGPFPPAALLTVGVLSATSRVAVACADTAT